MDFVFGEKRQKQWDKKNKIEKSPWKLLLLFKYIDQTLKINLYVSQLKNSNKKYLISQYVTYW